MFQFYFFYVQFYVLLQHSARSASNLFRRNYYGSLLTNIIYLFRMTKRYTLKWCHLGGKEIPIVIQTRHGPCALIACFNCLSIIQRDLVLSIFEKKNKLNLKSIATDFFDEVLMDCSIELGLSVCLICSFLVSFLRTI